MLNNNQRNKESINLNSNIGVQPCFLFIGKNTDSSLLSTKILHKKWAGVISTSDSEDLIIKFSIPGRTVLDISSINEIQPNRMKMPFVSLKKVIEIDPDDSKEDQNRDFSIGLQKVLLRLMQNTNHLYVVGYNEEEFDIGYFDRNICRNSVFFFGLSDTQLSDTAVNRAEKYGFRYYEETLDELLPDEPDTDGEEDGFSEFEDSLLFYINEKTYSLPRYEFMSTRSFITLANKMDVEDNIPYGKEMQRRYFRKFLEFSSDSPPQWYAYSQKTQFAVERSFEEGLKNITCLALNGETMPDGNPYDPKKPIVLMGPPSSSKTIALGALAYKVFIEKVYPVIYVRDDIQKLTNGENRKYLVNMVQKINQLDANGKLLIICDCSSYRNTFAFAKTLASYLNNLGKRFVLVLSSYEHKDSQGDIKQGYNWNNNTYVLAEATEPTECEMIRTDSYWIVRASRIISNNEAVKIRNLFKNSGGVELPQQSWDNFVNRTQGDIFEYFFYLTDLVRNSMREGLRAEKVSFRNYFAGELEKIYKKKYLRSGNNLGSLFPELFEAFGYKQEDTEHKELEYPKEEFDNFQTCIALFSQYSIDVPRTLAMCNFKESINTSIYYSTNEYEHSLDIFLTESIPWIHYKEIDGAFFFSFRNTREAIEYINDRFPEMNGREDFLNFVLFLMDQYKDVYSDSGANPEIVEALTALLREIGPNAQTWNQYRGNDLRKVYIKDNLDKVIEKMGEIVKAGLDSEYRIALNMFTFRREYYGNLDPYMDDDPTKVKEKFEYILKELRETIKMCYDTLDKLTNQQYFNHNQKAQITNENVLCNIRAQSFRKSYVEHCKAYGLYIDPDLANKQFSSFSDMFTSMETVIYSYPSNGFYYNSLFSLFEEYVISPKEKLSYCGRVAAIIELVGINDITSTGANGTDELGKHIAKFHAMMQNEYADITIDSIQDQCNNLTNFKQKFEEANGNGDSSYIWLVCYNELVGVGIIGDKDRYKSSIVLNSNQITVCKKVYEFMEKYKYTVKKDLISLQLMFRVYWMFNAGSKPQVVHNSKNECRLTHFNKSQWATINEISYDYCQLCDEKGVSGQPFMRYICALSTIYSSFNKDGFDRCLALLGNRNEDSFSAHERRMFTPFVLCDENGNPLRFSGSIKSVNNENNGTMSVRINDTFTIDCTVRCTNIGESHMPDVECGRTASKIYNNLVIGISYTRLQVYSEEVVKCKELGRKKDGK